MASLIQTEIGIVYSSLYCERESGESGADMPVLDWKGGKEFHWSPLQRRHAVVMYVKVNKTTEKTSQQHVTRLQWRDVQVAARLGSRLSAAALLKSSREYVR